MAVNELTEYLKNAFEYKNNGDYKEAIDYFYKALALDSESIEIMRELAELYTKLCIYDRAVSFYEQMLAIVPDDDNAKFHLADIYRLKKDFVKSEKLFTELYDKGYNIEHVAEKLFPILINNGEYEKVTCLFNKHVNQIKSSQILYYAAYSFEKLGLKKPAEEYYNRSYTNDGNNIKSGAHLAYNLYENGKQQEAENLCLGLLKNGECEEIYTLLAEIYYSKSDIDSALKYYSYAIRINPQNADNYFRIAVLFSLKGYYNEAEECFCRAIAFDPENLIYNYALAYMYYTQNKYDIAENIVDLILNIKSDDVQTIALKVLLMIKSNNTANIIQQVNKLNSVAGEYDFAHYVLAVYYDEIKMFDKSLISIKRAVELNPESVEYRYFLANNYFETQNFEEAEKICCEIIGEKPTYIQAYITLAMIYIKDKKYKEALISINKALSLDENNSKAYYLLAEIDFETRNYQKAIENYKIAVSISPDDEKIYAKIAQCYYIVQNYEEALIYYKEAADCDVSNALYRYYTAKCYANLNNSEEALASFSIMKRLVPFNKEYIKEYADYVYSIGKKSMAKKLMTSLMKFLTKEEQFEIKKIIKTYK